MRRTALIVATLLTACTRHRISNVGPELVVPTMVVVRNADLGQDAASPDLVVIVRDVDQPDLGIQDALIALVAPVADASRPDRRTAVSRVGGIATLALPAGASSILLVRRVGYTAIKITVSARPHCRQVLEIYMVQDLMRLDNVPGPSSPRATLTTCSPPA